MFQMLKLNKTLITKRCLAAGTTGTPRQHQRSQRMIKLFQRYFAPYFRLLTSVRAGRPSFLEAPGCVCSGIRHSPLHPQTFHASAGVDVALMTLRWNLRREPKIGFELRELRTGYLNFQLGGPLYVAGAVALPHPCVLLPLAVFLGIVASVNVVVMLSLRAAGIFSTSIEAILYGYAVFMFTLAMWIMLRDRSRRRVNYYMVFAGCTLLTLATAEMAVNIARVYEGFLSKGPDIDGGPEAYFADVSQPTFVIKSCLYNTQTLVLDGVVIYRTYVVWQNILVCILPIIGWFGLLACSIGLNIAIATASSDKGDVFSVQTGQWITSVYALSLATNLLTTLLLAFKIWNVARKSAQYRSTNIFTPVLRVIIESGAVYSITITAALISFVVESNGVYVVLDMISPIISIVFNMLIIRIGLANDRSRGTSGTTNGGGVGVGSGWGPAATDRSASAAVRRRPDGTFEMRDLKVEITQVVEHDAEYGRALAIGADGVKRADGELELEGEEDESTTTRGSYVPGKAAQLRGLGSDAPS